MNDCPHNINNICEIASSISGLSIPIDEPTCTACSICPRPRRLNNHTIMLALVYKPDLDTTHIRSVVDGLSPGFGTRLANTLSLLFQELPGCGCVGHKDILDTWTPQVIRQNLEGTIDWLQSEAKSRGLPFFRPAVRLMLQTLLLYEESRTV